MVQRGSITRWCPRPGGSEQTSRSITATVHPRADRRCTDPAQAHHERLIDLAPERRLGARRARAITTCSTTRLVAPLAAVRPLETCPRTRIALVTRGITTCCRSRARCAASVGQEPSKGRAADARTGHLVARESSRCVHTEPSYVRIDAHGWA